MKNLVLVGLVASVAFLNSCLSADDGDYITAQEQLAIDISIIEDYLDDNQIVAQQDPSGIFFIHSVAGTGTAPVDSDSVLVSYSLKLLNGTVKDEGVNKKFKLNQLIPAWRIAIPWMQEGGSMTIYAPSGYCYGNYSAGSIPPNSILNFDIELHEVIPNTGQ